MANLLAFFRLTIAPAALLACGGAVLAQSDFPAKPIRFLVEPAPGGATDILALALSPKVVPAAGIKADQRVRRARI